MTIALELSCPAQPSGAYPILIGRGLLTDGKTLGAQVPQRQVCIVSNATIAPLFLDTVKSALGRNRQIIEVILPDGEGFKNLEHYGDILDALIAARFSRDSVLLALGGGVIGDLTGFAAASYQRGVSFVQLPTTLLAQVDSSVGGKTGVNHPHGKNMIGAFHQPQAVVIDTETLNTLPPREFSAGLAEVIKYGLIDDLPFFSWLEQHMDAIMAHDAAILSEVIAHCCSNKARIVAADEYEHGRRALLNLGHTFGHALESLAHYTQWNHGEAIAIGIRIAAELSELRGGISEQDSARIIRLLRSAGLPIAIEGAFTSDAIYQAMFYDKKVRAGKLRLILMQRMGQCEIVSDVPQEMIQCAIEKAA